ncbi:MAG: glycosyltransferase family 2 protein [Flavobacteriales bacterium]|nr:glycosyltransferase family 2 protein [Flavobacteriales bacterium]
MPEVAFIIVSHNTREVLRDCLMSIAEHAGVEHEIILVDNASEDGTPDMVRADFPGVRLVASPLNLGFSPANNQGIALAAAPWLVLLNPDTELHPGVMRAWIDGHLWHGAAISGPRLLNPDGTLQKSAWRIPGLVSATLELLGLHQLFHAHAYPSDCFTKDFQPGFVSGAAMLFHRDWSTRIGGLDPALFWCEDTDLCMRIVAAGGSCWFITRAELMHIGGESAKRNPKRAIPNQLLSRIKLATKHRHKVIAGLVAMVIGLHIVTRIMAFGLISVMRKEPRASAYRHAWTRYRDYLIHGDHSI